MSSGKEKTFLRNREEIDFKKAKQRASIKWLLAKAYNHKTPQELREPFYKDHDDVERLKPHIVRSLANAEFYCMALSNLYADPNFHNLNHWGIIQALARKGIVVSEPTDCALTETMLIQTTPLKLSAHMAVIEALMHLFIKELVAVERITSTVKRFAPVEDSERPKDQEEALVLWMNKCAEALRKKADKELESNGEASSNEVPRFPKLNDLSDLKKGVGLAVALALYCPDDFPWSDIAGIFEGENGAPSMADSLYNLQLVQRFCRDTLPFNFCHLSLEDIVYMHDTIQVNVLAFLADLYAGLELRPVLRSIQLPGVKKDQVIEVPDPDMHRPSTLRRLSSMNERGDKVAGTPTTPTPEDPFVVQRGRTVPTLSSVVRTASPDLDKHAKERQNQDTKSEERGETDLSNVSSNGEPISLLQQAKSIPCAGRPSDTPRRSSIAGRRSRRNSIDDANASQLSLEHLGGSQNDLSMLGRNPDKEMRTHTGRKSELTSYSNDHQRFIDNRELEEMEKHQREGSPFGGKVSESPEHKVSFADFRRQKARDQFHSSAINITYTDNEKEDAPKRSSLLQRKDSYKESVTPTRNESQDSGTTDAMASQLNSVRLKLEQRRKRIEDEKRKMEAVMARQREKDLTDDLSAVQSRWLSDRNKPGAGPRTPDIEAMDVETYSKSLTAMNDSLHELQSDIHRLAQQQSQIQLMMAGQRMETSPQPHNPMDPQPFYIASPDPPISTPQRRTWGQPQPISFAHQQGGPMDPGWPRRQQWGGHAPQPQRPPNYGYGGQYGDPYGSPMRDQWGNPMMSQPGPMYNGQYSDQQYGYNNSVYGGNGYPYSSPQQQMGPSPPVSGSPYYQTTPSTPSRTPFRLHDGPKASSPLANSSNSPSSIAQRIAALGSNRRTSDSEPLSAPPGSQPSVPSYSRQNSRDSVSSNRDLIGPHRPHSSVPAPEEDEMAPQNVSFIDSSAEDEPDKTSQNLSDRLSQLNITSGTKTYRVHHSSDKESSMSPSPTRTRPTISSTFKQHRKGSGGESSAGPASLRSLSGQGLTEEEAEALAAMKTEKLKEDTDPSKGFVISFDDDTPKKPKPQLKQRRPSSKKNSMVSEMSSDGSNSSRKENVPPELMICIDMNMGDDGSDGTTRGSSPYRSKYQSSNHRGLKNGTSGGNEPASWRSYSESEPVGSGAIIPKFDVDPEVPLETMVTLTGNSESESDGGKAGTGLLIGEELLHVDPDTQEEMQRKKERIMMQSLRRKQQAEENRLRKEEELRRKREEESKKEEEKQRKKEEEKQRREAILQQFRLKKESENQDDDHIPEPVSARPVPKLRAKSGAKAPVRPRPKTIHVDQGSDVSASLPSSRGQRGSSSNLSGNPSGPLRRTDSRNSVNRGTGGGGISLASMGTGRMSASNANLRQPSTLSRSSSRRGSNSFLDDNTATLPPSGAALSAKNLDWAARQASTLRRKHSTVSEVEGNVGQNDSLILLTTNDTEPLNREITVEKNPWFNLSYLV